jgi:hypothetical protein
VIIASSASRPCGLRQLSPRISQAGAGRSAGAEGRRGGGAAGAEPGQGRTRARSHCRLAPPLIHSIPDLLTYSVPRFLKRQCDRTLGRTAEDLQSAAEGRAQRAAGGAAGPGLQAQADRSGPASAGAVKCPQRFPQQIVFVWRFCMGAHGA